MYVEDGACHFGGNVAIGNVWPSAQIHLSMDSAKKPTSDAWTITSDTRIKLDQSPIPTTDMLDKINALTIKKFKYDPHYLKATQSEDRYYTGIIADEVQAIFPCCVRVEPEQSFSYIRTKDDPDNLPLNQYCTVADDENDETKETVKMTIPECKVFTSDTIRYMMVGAIQELKKLVQSQATAIKSCNTTIADLTARVAVLENP